MKAQDVEKLELNLAEFLQNLTLKTKNAPLVIPAMHQCANCGKCLG